MDTGNKIKALRKAMGLTQTELGERVGVKKNAVSKWECGRVEDIPVSTLKALASLFDVPLSYLIDSGQDVATPPPHKIRREDIVFAFFRGREDITDSMCEELQNFADFLVAQKDQKKFP